MDDKSKRIEELEKQLREAEEKRKKSERLVTAVKEKNSNLLKDVSDYLLYIIFKDNYSLGPFFFFLIGRYHMFQLNPLLRWKINLFLCA